MRFRTFCETVSLRCRKIAAFWKMSPNHLRKIFIKSKSRIITSLLLGYFRSSAPFRDVFPISVALSLGVVLRLGNFTPGGKEVWVVGRNTRWKQDNKKNL